MQKPGKVCVRKDSGIGKGVDGWNGRRDGEKKEGMKDHSCTVLACTYVVGYIHGGSD